MPYGCMRRGLSKAVSQWVHISEQLQTAVAALAVVAATIAAAQIKLLNIIILPPHSLYISYGNLHHPGYAKRETGGMTMLLFSLLYSFEDAV